MRKPGAKPHRQYRQSGLAQLQRDRAIETLDLLARGEPLATYHRRLLLDLLERVLADQDVRDDYFETVAHAPSRTANRDSFIAVDYQMRRAAGERNVGKAVARAWGFRAKNAATQVKNISAAHPGAYLELASISSDKLRRVIDQQIALAKGTRTRRT